MAQEKVLLVDDDEVLLGVLGGFLRNKGYEVQTAKDGEEAIHLVHQGEPPSLVITDVKMPGIDGLELTRRLRANRRTAHCPIIVLSDRKKTEDVLAGYSQGADEYVPKPVEMPVLAAKVETLLRRARAAAAEEPGMRLGKVIVFLHGKGGVGTTSLAVNAAVALVIAGSYPVVLLDLNLWFNSVALSLNLVPKHTLADLAGLAIAEVEDSALEEVILRHATNVWVVVGSSTPERAELVTPSTAADAIHRFRDRAEYVIVDAPASFSEVSLAAVDIADCVCLVTSPHVAALKATADCIDVLEKLGVPANRTLIILNQTSPSGLSARQVAAVLQRTPDVTIPYTDQFDAAADSGRPLVAAFPADAAVTAIRELGARLEAVEQRTAEAVPVESSGGRWEDSSGGRWVD